MTAAETPPGQVVRDLMRQTGQVALATGLAREDGLWPYVSLVLVALDHDASPLMLLSDLAEHTRNFSADPRVALLFDGTAGWRDPLAGPRASVLGQVEPASAPCLLERFIARHPGAEVYAGFADFKLYRVAVDRAHLVAGFGQIHWIEAKDLLFPVADRAELAEAEPGILRHMNDDHGDAVQIIAEQILGLAGTGWVLAGVDPEGCDLRRDGALVRAPFDRTVRDAESARAELVRLTKRARRLATDRAG